MKKRLKALLYLSVLGCYSTASALIVKNRTNQQAIVQVRYTTGGFLGICKKDYLDLAPQQSAEISLKTCLVKDYYVFHSQGRHCRVAHSIKARKSSPDVIEVHGDVHWTSFYEDNVKLWEQR